MWQYIIFCTLELVLHTLTYVQVPKTWLVKNIQIRNPIVYYNF